jgi:chorismate--pyruvate lyase
MLMGVTGKPAARPRPAGPRPEHTSLLPLDLWIPDAALLRGVPDHVGDWLTEPGLLTARVRAVSGGPCRLRVLEQRLDFLTVDQQAELEVPAGTCFVREIALCAGSVPWVYAQTVVPDATLELHPWLAELGETPLGETLAQVGGVEHGPLEFATLPAMHPLAAAALKDAADEPDFLWARRRWVAIRGRRLLVHELFLPGIEEC